MAKVNGKVVIPVFVVFGLVSGLIAYGELRNKVKTNEASIKKIEKAPLKISNIEIEVKHINQKLIEHKEDIDEVKVEQKAMRKEMDIGFEKILDAIKNNREIH